MGKWVGALALWCIVALGWTVAVHAQAADPALAPLLEALKDDEARARLIEALEASGAAAAPPQSQADLSGAADEGTGELQGLARRAAETMSRFTANLEQQITALSWDFERLRQLPNVLTPERWARITSEAPWLLLIIVATASVYRLLRAFARRAVDRPTGEANTFAGRMVAVVLQATLRAFGLLLAWIAGYLVAAAVGGGEVSVINALYLNGFLVVGVITFVLSLFVSYDPRDITLSDLSKDQEAVIYRSLKRLTSFLVYGIVTVVPISQAWTNFVIAGALRSLIVTIGAIMALVAIRKMWRAIHRSDATPTDQADATGPATQTADEDPDTVTELVANTTESIWARVWPFLAIAYVATAYWTAITQPSQMVEILGRATVFTLLALGIMIVSFRIMGQATSAKVPMPKAIARHLPSLGDRLNAFVPVFAVVLGLAGIIFAVIVVADVWYLGSLGPIFEESFLWMVANAALILGGTLVVWAVLSAWIDSRLQADGPRQAISARSRTLLSLLRNAITVALLLFGVINALSELGVNIAPILAGAGVLGLAIGFGAQKLVQDIITGVFIQLENAINEGDVITVAGITGTVETLTIRSVGIRDLAGVYHLIPFSAVDTVSNFMRGFAYHVEVVGVGYDADLKQVRAAMQEAFDELRKSAFGFQIIGPLEMHGVIAMAESSVNLRARIKTRPGQQWAVGRAYTEGVKAALDARGIEIPFPHRELKLPKEFLDSLKRPDTAIAPPKALAADGPVEAGALDTGGD